MATDYKIPAHKLVRPDKDHFLDEENPFEAMMSRFDKAAELLDLEPGMYKVLRQAEKQIIISIPVMMRSRSTKDTAFCTTLLAGRRKAEFGLTFRSHSKK
jgi:glutamate dehydrogenase (NAD(P)+)